MQKAIDLTGKKFGRWTVVGRVASSAKVAMWSVRCECGKTGEVQSGALRSGRSRSCGCLQAEEQGARMLKHGATAGRAMPLPYRIWCGIRRRCEDRNDPAYPRYGGRGIRVCERWADFAVFLADMGPMPTEDHTIDRINNDGNYEPSNCRWATKKEQARNRRNNRTVVHEGQPYVLAELAEKHGISGRLLAERLDAGWSVEEAVSVDPLDYHRRAGGAGR